MGILSEAYSLQSLNISDNKLGIASSVDIPDSLTGLRRLRSLSLASNDIGHLSMFRILEHLIAEKEARPRYFKMQVSTRHVHV